MCSIYEGLPIAALEAMALGVPVVSTPVDGIKDLIINNQTGYLSNDNIELENHIIDLITNELLYKKVRRNIYGKIKLINNESYFKMKLNEFYVKY